MHESSEIVTTPGSAWHVIAHLGVPWPLSANHDEASLAAQLANLLTWRHGGTEGASAFERAACSPYSLLHARLTAVARRHVSSTRAPDALLPSECRSGYPSYATDAEPTGEHTG